MAVNKIVNCAQVSDISAGIKQFRDAGCSLRFQSRSGCALMDCGKTDTYVCETPRDSPGLSASLHDEMDEPYIDYWKETPD